MSAPTTFDPSALEVGVLSVAQTARAFGVDASTLHAWIRRWQQGEEGAVPVVPVRVGGRWRFRRAEVEAWMRGSAA